MKNIFKKISTSLIIAVVLFSVLGLFGSASAQRKAFNFNFGTTLELIPDTKDLDTNVAPVTETRIIDLYIDYSITGLFQHALDFIKGAYQLTFIIEVDQNQLPDYVTVSVPQSVLNRNIEINGTIKTSLYVKFSEDAPATKPFNIPLKITIEDLDAPLIFIDGTTIEPTIPVTPNFLPDFNINIVKPYIEITPGDVAVFPIEIENTANGRTEFTLDVKNLPKGWTASIQSVITIPASETGDNKRTVYLQVSPPRTFGFFNEEINFDLKIEGKFFAPSATGILIPKNNTYLFTVGIQGFSFVGFEIPLIIIIIAIIVIAIYLIKWRKKK